MDDNKKNDLLKFILGLLIDPVSPAAEIGRGVGEKVGKAGVSVAKKGIETAKKVGEATNKAIDKAGDSPMELLAAIKGYIKEI